MDTRAFAATLLKVAGLVIIVHTLSRLPSFFPMRVDLHSTFLPSESIAVAALNLLPPLLLGFVLWWFPGKVASRIVISAGVDVVVGLFFVLGAKGIVNGLQSLRAKG